jgi:hypothetical protein
MKAVKLPVSSVCKHCMENLLCKFLNKRKAIFHRDAYILLRHILYISESGISKINAIPVTGHGGEMLRTP